MYADAGWQCVFRAAMCKFLIWMFDLRVLWDADGEKWEATLLISQKMYTRNEGNVEETLQI